MIFARTLLPLVQLPPAGHWRDTTRDARFVLDPRPLPDPEDAGALVLTRYLDAFGPAAKRDVAAWAGVAQRDFAWQRVETVTYRDEQRPRAARPPGRAAPPAHTPLPPRFLANWDQPLLAYKDRDRIIPPEVQPLKLTLSGDRRSPSTAASPPAGRWTAPQLTITPHTDFAARRGRARRRCAPPASAPPSRRHEVA